MLPPEMANMSQSSLIVLFIFSLGISLGSVLVALDARDRGLNKTVCVAWFFAIIIFPPVLFAYLVSRNISIAMKSGSAFKQASKKEEIPYAEECPYCGATGDAGAKICSACGRLL